MAQQSDTSDRMADLQKMRVALVILISQENTKLLSRRQKVAGLEIHIMGAERDLHAGLAPEENGRLLETLYLEDTAARAALAEIEMELERMEDIMSKIDADISALCQS